MNTLRPLSDENAVEHRHAKLVLILSILMLGIALRIVGMTWGLPYQLEPDEPVLFINAWERWNGNTPSLQTDYPPVYLYALMTQREFIYQVFGEDTPQLVYFFFGRWNSILLSLLIMGAAYAVGKASQGFYAGLAFALFMSLEPVGTSTINWIIKVDNLSWLLSLFCLLFSVYAMRGRSWLAWSIAIIFAILATFTKYNLVFVILAPLYVLLHFLIKRDVLVAGLLIGGTILGLLATGAILRATWVDYIGPSFYHCRADYDPEVYEFDSSARTELPCGIFAVLSTYAYTLYQPQEATGYTYENALQHLRNLMVTEFGTWRLLLGGAVIGYGLWQSQTRRMALMALTVGVLSLILFGLIAAQHPIRQYYIFDYLCGLGVGSWDACCGATLYSAVRRIAHDFHLALWSGCSAGAAGISQARFASGNRRIYVKPCAAG